MVLRILILILLLILIWDITYGSIVATLLNCHSKLLQPVYRLSVQIHCESDKISTFFPMFVHNLIFYGNFEEEILIL